MFLDILGQLTVSVVTLNYLGISAFRWSFIIEHLDIIFCLIYLIAVNCPINMLLDMVI